MNYRVRNIVEIFIHCIFWAFIFLAVNVDWSADWFDRSLRMNTPSPFSVVIIPIIFYAHAFWAIPKYLSNKKWFSYGLSFLLIFILPEFVRIGLFYNFHGTEILDEMQSRDSFILGSPNVFWISLVFSFAYRFSKDWFIHQRIIRQMKLNFPDSLEGKKKSAVQPLDTNEANLLKKELNILFNNNKPYLNKKLSLREVADSLNTTDKKLSTLLNRNMDTNFADFVNKYRISYFLEKAKSGDLDLFSITGLATKCGFPSKTSFFRAFKKETGRTPSDYLGLAEKH